MTRWGRRTRTSTQRLAASSSRTGAAGRAVDPSRHVMSNTLFWRTAVIAELGRLGLLVSGHGGSHAVAAALREAFGDDRWTLLHDDAVVERLRSACALPGVPGERRPRYAALTANGVLECLIAIGFDEAVDSAGEEPRAGTARRVEALAAALRARGYSEGIEGAAPLLARRGRNVERTPWTTYLARQDGLTVTSPAGGDRTVGVVVRIVANTTGTYGEQAASAFVDGLTYAPLCVYAGHSRYGMGADFEPAVAVEWASPKGEYSAADPGRLAKAVAQEARNRGTTADSVVAEWAAARCLVIRRSSRSRVLLDAPRRARGPHGRLVAALAGYPRDDEPGLAVGPHGRLATSVRSEAHRVWFLLSCTSTAWFPVIRSTPGLTPAALRLVGCTERARFADATAFLWALDAMATGGTWTDILRALGNPRDGSAPRFVVDGAEEDGLVV
jgi:hypothetical protein